MGELVWVIRYITSRTIAYRRGSRFLRFRFVWPLSQADALFVFSSRFCESLWIHRWLLKYLLWRFRLVSIYKRFWRYHRWMRLWNKISFKVVVLWIWWWWILINLSIYLSLPRWVRAWWVNRRFSNLNVRSQ